MEIPNKNIWSDCKRLVVVFPYRNEENYKTYRLALDQLLNESNIQELQIVVTLSATTKIENLQQHKLIQYISPKDINMFGKMKNDNFNAILIKKYDSLLWLEVNDKKFAKVLSTINATWKIGVNTSLDFFNIQVNSNSENPLEIVNFAKNTLEKIS